MKTVEELLGVPIDYYAQIDFNAFVKFIDEIGGVKIDVPEKIAIDPLGDNNIEDAQARRPDPAPASWPWPMPAPAKTEGGDFDRAQRQQQVILAHPQPDPAPDDAA